MAVQLACRSTFRSFATDRSSAKASPDPTERMRMSRKRRRNGLHYISVPLHETEIDGLVAKGHLRSEQRGNRKAVKDALDGFVIRELGLPEQES